MRPRSSRSELVTLDRSRALKLLVLPSLAGFLAALGAYFLFSASPRASSPAGETVRVVVAAKDLSARTRISREDLTVKAIPREAVWPGVLGDPGEAVGKVLLADTKAGQPLSRGMLAYPEDKLRLPFKVPPGKRAYAFSGVESSGFLAPGDRVDAIAVLPPRGEGDEEKAVVFLRDIPVVESGGEKKKEVVLALDPGEAAAFALAQQYGKVTLVLRPVVPEEKGEAVRIGMGDLSRGVIR